MRRLGRVTRAYPIIQDLIRRSHLANTPITTATLQQTYYGVDFSHFDIRQRGTIHQCIKRGQRNSSRRWTFYTRSAEFDADIAQLLLEEPDIVETAMETPDYEEYEAAAIAGQFGEEIQEGIDNGDLTYPAISVLFERRIEGSSVAGHTLLIAEGGPNSQWFIPSYWRWGIYLRDISLRLLKGSRTLIQYGIETRALLPSGDLFQRALDLTTTVRAALMDGTAWECPSCGARNIAERDECVICGTTQP